MASHCDEQAAAIKPPLFFEPIDADKYCALCQLIRARSLRLQHHDYRMLRLAAAQGCPLCRFLFTEVVLRSRVAAERLNNDDARMILDRHDSTIEVTDFYGKITLLEIFCESSFSSHLQSGTDATSDVSSRVQGIRFCEMSVDPWSHTCWNLIQHWLGTCEMEHESCRRNQDGQRLAMPLPTRLVYVGGETLKPKLVLSGGQKGVYTTLSHCWGAKMDQTITERTLEDRRVGLDTILLPQTFLDAMDITRRLGIDFIWIDSLCIIQDSVEDWQHEAASMATIYENSHLNISSLGSADSNAGIIHIRKLAPSASLGDGFQVRQAAPSWGSVFRDSPLSRRGWVLQERLLARRVLHFGRAELFWECLTCSVRESDSTQYADRDQSVDWRHPNFKRSLLFPNIPLEDDDDWSNVQRYQILTKWHSICSQMSRLTFTLPADIIPAMSGIAAKFMPALGNRQVVGMWLNHFHSELLWFIDEAKPPGLIRSQSIAPSWSWISTRAPIQYLSTVQPKISWHSLQISCIEYEENISTPQTQWPKLMVKGRKANFWLKNLHADTPFNDPSLRQFVMIYNAAGHQVGSGRLDDLSGQQKPRLYHAVEVCEGKPRDDAVLRLYFLIISPILDMPGKFRRIGIGQTHDDIRDLPFGNSLFDDSEMEEFELL